MTNHHVRTQTKKETTMPGPLSSAHTVTKLPAQDLERARGFYRDKLGLEPVEERTGGLRYVCGPTEFHLFSSAGASSGASTQMAFEVEDLEPTLVDLRARGVTFERFEMPRFDVRGDTIAAPPTTIRPRAPASSARSSSTAKATSSGSPADPRGRDAGARNPKACVRCLSPSSGQAQRAEPVSDRTPAANARSAEGELSILQSVSLMMLNQIRLRTSGW